MCSLTDLWIVSKFYLPFSSLLSPPVRVAWESLPPINLNPYLPHPILMGRLGSRATILPGFTPAMEISGLMGRLEVEPQPSNNYIAVFLLRSLEKILGLEKRATRNRTIVPFFRRATPPPPTPRWKALDDSPSCNSIRNIEQMQYIESLM